MRLKNTELKMTFGSVRSPAGGSTPNRYRYFAAFDSSTEAPIDTPTAMLSPSLLWQGKDSSRADVPRSRDATHSRLNGVRSTMISRPAGM